ncbi:MAG: 4Fe-4S binding protein, partial [Proteobacteria bacterium]|nr:4Fe-4S binding protein [Pseudomonadota bacterium]
MWHFSAREEGVYYPLKKNSILVGLFESRAEEIEIVKGNDHSMRGERSDLMEWEKEAEERHELMPIPPNVSTFARKQAEKCARNKGAQRVTVKEVLEAEEAYADFFGREKTQEMRNAFEGKEPVPQMVEELFFESSGMLYNIQVCPVKYGSQGKEVTDGIVSIYREVKNIFEKENVEQIISDLSRIPLCESSCFNVVITGCSNCCEPPFFKDLGIIGQHIPEVSGVECLQCKKCLSVCIEDAITLRDDGPVINRERCINCEFCAKTCPAEKIVVG